MPINDFLVDSLFGSYGVNFVNDAQFLMHYPEPRLFIIDRNVFDLYKNELFNSIRDPNIILLDVDENRKSMETVQELYRAIIKLNAKKNLNVISIGGGITQDITGFLCSTIYRGIQWGYVPTTLLSQADSCIGSKTSLNFEGFKNIVGTFYPPHNIKIYVPFLRTLKQDDFYSGLGEVAKLHITGGQKLTDYLIANLTAIGEKQEGFMAEAIYDSLIIKKEFIEKDEFDRGLRNLLNYGHCIGHALESVSHYSIPHGQAIVVGMILANLVSRKREYLSGNSEKCLFDNLLIRILKFRFMDLLNATDANAIFAAMKKDKKRVVSGVPLVLLKDNFKLEKCDDFTEQELKYAIDTLSARVKNNERW